MRNRIPLIAVATALFPGLALATVNLKKVNIVDGSRIELVFDGKVDPGQVKTEYVRDNIQLSLSNASVYPAKVSMVSGSDLTKVFAYQYSPSLVRARFTVKGEAQSYASRLQVKVSGKTLTVRIAPSKTDAVTTSNASALRTISAPEKSVEPAAAAAAEEAEQKALLSRVSATEREKTAAAPSSAKPARVEPLAGGGQPLPSPLRTIGVLLFVLGMFGLFVMFLRRFKGNGSSASARESRKSGLGGLLNRLSGSNSAKPMIEVVATHALAPKRSIVVVRVRDRMLVLGMANDSVNLITEFRSGEDGEAEETIGIGDFAASLRKFENDEVSPPTTTKLSPKANLGDVAAAALGLSKPKPKSAPQASAAASAYRSASAPAGASAAGEPAFSPALAAALKEPSVKPSIRAQIKDRVQGMKRL